MLLIGKRKQPFIDGWEICAKNFSPQFTYLGFYEFSKKWNSFGTCNNQLMEVLISHYTFEKG